MNVKSLTTENWLQPDEEGLASLSATNGNESGTVSSEEWLALCGEPELTLKVPRNVRSHFEAARGALAYGYYFFPLYMLAVEQIHRAAEWAVLQKCKETNRKIIDHKGRQIDFYQGLAFLRHSEHITKQEFHDWEEIRKFRNKTANPKKPNEPLALPPAEMGKHLKNVAVMINGLFK